MAELRGVYQGEIPSTLDILIPQQNMLVALAQFCQDVLQSTTNPANQTNPSLVAGFVPTYPGALSVNLSAGRLYSIAQVNPTAYGDLSIDTRNVLQQAQTDAQTLTFAAAPGTAGQSRIDLVQVALVVTDDQMAVLPYYNSSNPAVPYNGPANSGTAQANRRWRKAVVTIKQGTAGTTPTAPTADAGNFPLLRMTIANGTTVLSATNITVDPSAAFVAGVTTQHHTGTPGSAPKIMLTGSAEVQGILPAANMSYAQLVAALGLTPVNRAGDTMTGVLTLFADPTNALDAATKQYVDAVATGFAPKAPVRAATTANITLSGLQTIDGVVLTTADRVLVKNQTTGSQNGLYTAASGAWVRTTDFDSSIESVPGSSVFVNEGTVYGDSTWVLTTNAPITLGTTSLTFMQFSGLGDITVTTSFVKNGNQLQLSIASPTVLGGVQVQAGANITIDGSGNISVTSANVLAALGTQAAHAVLVGPTTGTAAPTFRALVASDMPAGFGGSNAGGIRQTVLQAAVDLNGLPNYVVGGLSSVNTATPARAISGGDNGANVKGNAFDGTGNLFWASSQTTGASINGTSYIGQDAGSGNTVNVAGLRITQDVPYANNNMSSVLFQTSPDGTTWTTQQTLTMSYSQSVFNFVFATTYTTRAWRLLANASPYNSSGSSWIVLELQAFDYVGSSRTAVDLKATTTNVLMTFAGGNTTTGPTDYFQAITSDVNSAWSGLTSGVTNYLYIDRNSGTPTYNSNVYSPFVGNAYLPANTPSNSPTGWLAPTSSAFPFTGIASASGQDTGYEATKAFNGIVGSGDGWKYSVAPTQYVQIDMGSNQHITQYRIYCQSSDGTGRPTAFNLSGSNDNSSFTTLDTRSSITLTTDAYTTWTVTTPGTYRYYRLTVTAVNSGSNVSVPELGLFADIAGTALAPSTNQHWYNPATGLMQYWNGSSWVATQRLFVGHALMSGANVQSVVQYPIGNLILSGALISLGSPNVIAYATAAQSIPATTNTKLTFDKILKDVQGEFSLSSYTAKIAGDRTITGMYHFGNNASGSNLYVYAYLNGSVYSTLGTINLYTATSGFLKFFDTIPMNIGDVLEIYVYQPTAVNSAVNGTTPYQDTFVKIKYVP